jgi:hypothetical protein
MGKLRVVVYTFFLTVLCLSSVATAGYIELYDRSVDTGTVMVEFTADMVDPKPNGHFTPTSTMVDSDSFSGSVSRGYPYDYSWITPSDNTYAKSTIDFSKGSISSLVQYQYGNPNYYAFNDARIDIYSKMLPNSYSLSGTGTTYNSRFILQVFDNSNTALGFTILSRQGDNYQLVVRSLNDSRDPLVNWQWISLADTPDQSDLLAYVNWIVNGRSTDYYYKIGAEVSTTDPNGGSFSAALDFGNNTPVPLPSAIYFLGTGLAGIAGFRKRKKK